MNMRTVILLSAGALVALAMAAQHTLLLLS